MDRLYPSLPSTNRLDVCRLSCSSANTTDTSDHHPPDKLLKNTQGEESLVRMKEQMHVLETQKQELLSINERWAKEYRVMVQYYKEKLRNLKASLPPENCGGPSAEARHVCQLDVVKDAAAGSGDVLLKAQSEARLLQEQNRALARRGQHQNAEITRLNKALEEVTASCQEVSSETLQDLWKHQADVYREDFLTERKDREALKDKYLQLEKKYKRVRNELYSIQSQITISQPRCECTCTKPRNHPEEKTQSSSDKKLQRRYTFKDNL